MNRRLYRAISEATEFRAILVLMVILALRVWRFAQSKRLLVPSLIDVIEYIRRRFNARLTRYLYGGRVHWIGTR